MFGSFAVAMIYRRLGGPSLFDFAKELVWSVALEFCFRGEIKLQGKEYTKWSDLRCFLSQSIANSRVTSKVALRGSGSPGQNSIQDLLSSALAEATDSEKSLGRALSLGALHASNRGGPHWQCRGLRY